MLFVAIKHPFSSFLLCSVIVELAVVGEGESALAHQVMLCARSPLARPLAFSYPEHVAAVTRAAE